MAIAAQDGLARTIRPSHTPVDGDTVFAVATGAVEVPPGPGTPVAMSPETPVVAAVGAAAADCLARAVLVANKAARLGFVLSTSARSPLAEMAISNGLRPGLGMLVKQLADEIGPDGGRTFGLLPGSIATQRLLELAKDAGAEAQIPLRRFGRPEEVGRVAAFLLSDAASYLTGCLVPVDGGVGRAL